MQEKQASMDMIVLSSLQILEDQRAKWCTLSTTLVSSNMSTGPRVKQSNILVLNIDEQLLIRLEVFSPHCFLVSSWEVPALDG